MTDNERFDAFTVLGHVFDCLCVNRGQHEPCPPFLIPRLNKRKDASTTWRYRMFWPWRFRDELGPTGCETFCLCQVLCHKFIEWISWFMLIVINDMILQKERNPLSLSMGICQISSEARGSRIERSARWGTTFWGTTFWAKTLWDKLGESTGNPPYEKYGGVPFRHRATPIFIIHFGLGFSPTKTIQLWGYLHDELENPHARWQGHDMSMAWSPPRPPRSDPWEFSPRWVEHVAETPRHEHVLEDYWLIYYIYIYVYKYIYIYVYICVYIYICIYVYIYICIYIYIYEYIYIYVYINI